MDIGLNCKAINSLFLIGILITAAFSSACSNNRYVPVNERNQPPSTSLSSHRVAGGETLFSIAWRYGLNYKSLARNNRISSPYTIYPGQTLSLKASKRSQGKPPKKSKRVKKSTSKAKVNSYSRSKKQAKVVKKSSSNVGYSTSFSWQWPSAGPLLKKYSQGSSVNKGIDIGGKKGESVTTAAPGRVVYSGDGLRGYGKLVIVKHNEDYLSAYAHNNRLFVKEDQVVKAGQKIAEIGSSGTDKNMLHFEIRRDGKPVDPLKYLPRR